MCGLCIWPEPNSQYLECGISIALSNAQSASGILHGGKRLFFSPLHATVVCIYSGEGNIWMSWVTKLSSKPVPAHWTQLRHSVLKIGEGESVSTCTGSWKTVCMTFPAAQSVLQAQQNQLPTAFMGSQQQLSWLLPAQGFFLFTSFISSRDTGPGARPQPQPAFDLVCSEVLLWACMDKVFFEEPQTRLYLHCAEIMEAREGGWHRDSLRLALKMSAKGVLILCVPSTLS